MKYSVGQELYLVGNYTKGLVTVEKVGRRYATLVGIRGKIEIETDQLKDNDYCLGKLYPTEQAYKDSVLKAKLIWDLRQKLSGLDSSKLILDQVKEVYKILGIKIDEN